MFNNEAFINDTIEAEKDFTDKNEPERKHDEENEEDSSSDEEDCEQTSDEKVSKVALLLLNFRLKVEALKKKVFKFFDFFVLVLILRNSRCFHKALFSKSCDWNLYIVVCCLLYNINETK